MSGETWIEDVEQTDEMTKSVRTNIRSRRRRLRCWFFHERKGEVLTTRGSEIGMIVEQSSRLWCLNEGILIYERKVTFH